MGKLAPEMLANAYQSRLDELHPLAESLLALEAGYVKRAMEVVPYWSEVVATMPAVKPKAVKVEN